MSKETQRLTHMHVQIHTRAHTHVSCTDTHTETCTHAGACTHTDLGEAPRDYINAKIPKKTEKEKEPERRGKERETKPMHPHQECSFGVHTQI